MNNILLLGDIVIDRYYHGTTNRISPERPVPIVSINSIENELGCIGNVLENVRAFFDNIYLVTCVDKDTIQPIIQKVETYPNVTHVNFHQHDRKLIIKNRVMSNNHYISRFDIETISSVNSDNEVKIIEYIKYIAHDINIIVLSDYSKGFLTYSLCQDTIKIAHQNNAVVFVDPKGTDYTKYRYSIICYFR